MDFMISFFTIVVIAVPSIFSARILGVFPLMGASHFRFTHPVMRTLAEAGHEIVVYSPFPNLLEEPANFTHIHIESIPVQFDRKKLAEGIATLSSIPFWKCLDMRWALADRFYNQVVADEEMQKLFSSSEKFDLIVTEQFNIQEFILILSSKFKAPVIGLQTFASNNILNSNLGNALSMSYIPDLCTGFSNKMSFLERLSNVFSITRGLYYHYHYYIPRLENRMRADFPDAPSLEEMAKNVTLVFVNDHLTVDYVHPRSPNIIPVAGIHIQSPHPLPQSILKFMDDAEDGVIFFSLGTYVPDEVKSKDHFKMFINVFKKLKQRVLWKTGKENITDLPENVMTMKWAPQQDILAHPKCVLFITHGGQLSRVEALHFAVPVISIPHFSDQHRNSAFYNYKKVGLRIPRNDVSEKTMSAAIRKVMDDPSYRENMKRLSAIFKDRPMSPAESVVYWTEYVIRHGGAPHLKPASIELRWYQLILLDVLMTFFVTVSISFSMLLYVSRNTLIFIKRKYMPQLHEKNN